MAAEYPFRTALWHLRKGGPKQLSVWLRRQRVDGRSAGIRSKAVTAAEGGRFVPMNMPVYEPIAKPVSFGQIRVGVIMDDFSLSSWSNEFTLVELTPDGWRRDLAGGVDFLFVESAWAGNHGAWQYQLTGSRAPSAPLQELVSHLRDEGIPTVFWNKEDPPHFADFLETAKLFDYVFTTDSNKIEAYKKALGHDRVDSLAFAAQPAMHNPIRMPQIHQRGDVAFAGMYFAHKYPERREQMDVLLGAAANVSPRMKSGLTIYSRHAGGDDKYQFPKPFDQYVVGSLEYNRMVSAYRAFKVFLNVNSVTNSPSMCARRVFEITASGTPVITGRSEAIPKFFPQDEVPVVDTVEEAEWTMRALVNSSGVRERMVHRAQRRIWGAHTYAHRAGQVLDAIGIEFDRSAIDTARVTAIVSTNRPHQLDHVLEQVGQQIGVEVELALLTHGFTVNEQELRAKAADKGIHNLQLLVGPKEWTLGDCLNALVEAASGDFVAKVDDDDLYGPNYLLDQINALRFSGADLVGKQAMYLYLGARDMMLLRSPEREHRWSTFVSGATLVAPISTLRENKFASLGRGEDSKLLESIAESGGSIYSADRFNFIAVRRESGHTWNIDDMQLMANGRVDTYGLSTKHVFA